VPKADISLGCRADGRQLEQAGMPQPGKLAQAARLQNRRAALSLPDQLPVCGSIIEQHKSIGMRKWAHIDQ